MEKEQLEGVVDQDTSGAWLATPTTKRSIGEKEVAKALETLARYKQGKANLERRVVEDERWYQLRHWEAIRGKNAAVGDCNGQSDQAAPRPEPASAWLFNSIMNKHADAMDNYPEANVLPRESGDTVDAKTISAILPVILERCDFEEKYSAGWWEKLKHGTAVYAPLWNSALENGLGDIEVGLVDLLNIFWEPGITDIQKSRNVFVVDLRDNDLLEGEYPQLKGKLGAVSGFDITKYVYDDTVDLTGKSAVIDWYYKVRAANGRAVLHYAKICAGQLLFASENDQRYTERGWYDHGEYPFVFDTLFPEKGTPVGFGYVALCKDPQLYIDKLSQIMLENAMMSGRKRFFMGANTGVNEEEFKDWSKPIIHVEGANNLDDTHIREFRVSPVSGSLLNILELKINELKETSANRDVSQGSAGSGVTAAAAIAALQEAGNKSSRDIIAGSYRAYTKLDYLIIELIRQFYSEQRSFRITGQGSGAYQFINWSNAGMADQSLGVDSAGNPLVRRPVFDIKIKAQKKNPFSQMSQNELAKELYAAGFFDPQRAQQVLGALEMMEFEGKDRVMEQVRQGETLQNQLQQATQLVQEMTAALQGGMVPGGGPMDEGVPAQSSRTPPGGGSGKSVAQREAEAQKPPMTPYGETLAQRAGPDMDTGGMA